MNIEQIKKQLCEDLYCIGLKYLDKYESQSSKASFGMIRGRNDIKVEVSDHIRHEVK